MNRRKFLMIAGRSAAVAPLLAVSELVKPAPKPMPRIKADDQMADLPERFNELAAMIEKLQE